MKSRSDIIKSIFERSRIMKKYFGIFCFLILIFTLTACKTYFNGSRTGNDSQLIMSYQVFNTTDSQKLTVTEGDIIHAEIIVKRGSLSFKIQKDGDLTPVYEGKDISFSDEFDIEIEESGTYIVTVTGKNTKGSVHFGLISNQ